MDIEKKNIKVLKLVTNLLKPSIGKTANSVVNVIRSKKMSPVYSSKRHTFKEA